LNTPVTSFDLERYRARIEESRRRIEIAKRFEQPDRVPIHTDLGGSFFCKMLGVNVREYFRDAWKSLDLQLEVQLRGLKWAFAELGDDRTGAGVSVDIGPIHEALVFDLPVEYPDDTSPWTARAISLEEAADKLAPRDPAENPRVLEAYRQVEKLRAKVDALGLRLFVGGGLQIHPPLSAACGFLDVDEVMEALATDPALVHRVFEKMFCAFIRLKDFHDRFFGSDPGSLWLADDHSAFVSDEMYRRHVMPYNMALYGRYGWKSRHLHADGPNDHHFATYADVVKLTSMDIGGFSDIANAKPAFAGKVFFSGGLNCKDLYYDLSHAKPAIDRALDIGMPGGGFMLAVGGETYAGVNPDTLCRAVEYAKQAGRYAAP
jgi:uroporphyrinogen-III decarboxylase